MKRKILLFALALAFFQFPLKAQQLSPELERQVKSGQLTREEASLLSGGMQRQQRTSTTSKPVPKQSTPSKEAVTSSVAFDCDLDPITDKSRKYRCCQLTSPQAVYAAYHDGAYYLDHDTDGIACEQFAAARVWNPVLQQNCANTFSVDLRYFMTRNGFSPFDSNRIDSHGRQIKTQSTATEAYYRGYVLVVDGHAVNFWDAKGTNKQFPIFEELAISNLRRLNAYADTACQNTSGLMIVAADAKLGSFSSTWDLAINGATYAELPKQYSQQSTLP